MVMRWGCAAPPTYARGNGRGPETWQCYMLLGDEPCKVLFCTSKPCKTTTNIVMLHEDRLLNLRLLKTGYAIVETDVESVRICGALVRE